MKNKLKKSVFLLSSLMMLTVGAGVVSGISESPVGVAEAATYVETSFGAGKMLITTTFDGSTYYLPATTTSSGPLAQSFTNVSEISDEHLWTITANGSNWYIQNSEGSYLYTTATNNGVRVGSTQRAWYYDAEANSFKDTTTNRYLGIYNASNWRCYTTVNQSNYKESSTSFVFYSVDTGAATVSISGDSSAEVGGIINLEATLSNITGDVTWTSSNEDVATVADGVVTTKAVGSTTITADVNGTSGTKEVKVYPVDGSSLSIEEILTVCELTGQVTSTYTYSVTGKVSAINEEGYNSTYNNISITLTDGVNSISCYRLSGGSDMVVGDEITVTGNVVNQWGTTPQFVAGATYEYVTYDNSEIKPSVSFDEENSAIVWTAVEGASGYHLRVLDSESNEVVNDDTLTETTYDVSSFANDTYYVTVKALGNNNYSDSAESDTYDFTLSQGVSAQFAAVETKSSLGFTYNAETVGEEQTETFDFSDSAQRESLTTEEQIWNTDNVKLTHSKAGSSTNIADYTNPIRFYKSSTITLSSESSISKIVVNCNTAAYATTLATSIGSEASCEDKVVTVSSIDATSYTITLSEGQVRVNSIDVTFGNAVTTYEFSDVRVRFAATISANVYDSLNIEAAGFEVTADGYSKSMDIDCTEKFATDENGDYFIICSIWQIPEEAYGTVLTAKAYFEVDGVRYYAQETSYSVITLAEAYLENSIYSTLSENAQGAITAFNAQLA